MIKWLHDLPYVHLCNRDRQLMNIYLKIEAYNFMDYAITNR